MHLLLIRHGRSAHVHGGGLLDRHGVERWRAAYDEAAVAPDDAPPAWLVDAVAGARVIAASDLPRAIASAERLADGRAVVLSPLFREVPLPIPEWLPCRAPLAAWDALVRLSWGVEQLRGHDAPPAALTRARLAARWCGAACRDASDRDATIAVVTHGVFRRVLARRLLADGWRAAPGFRSRAHWSAWRLHHRGRPATGEVPTTRDGAAWRPAVSWQSGRSPSS